MESRAGEEEKERKGQQLKERRGEREATNVDRQCCQTV
jgi:hypothetical protein